MSKRSIEDVLGAIKVPVRSVSICLAADLQAEHDELTADLERLRREPSGKMADGGQLQQVAGRIKAVEAEMRESEVVFKFRGLTKAARQKIEARFPPPDPNPDNLRWNVDEGAYALIAASAVEPVMSEQEAKKLLSSLDEGRADRLVNTAWVATTGSTTIPFSARASELTGGSD